MEAKTTGTRMRALSRIRAQKPTVNVLRRARGQNTLIEVMRRTKVRRV
jgi:hypothetical protein